MPYPLDVPEIEHLSDGLGVGDCEAHGLSPCGDDFAGVFAIELAFLLTTAV